VATCLGHMPEYKLLADLPLINRDNPTFDSPKVQFQLLRAQLLPPVTCLTNMPEFRLKAKGRNEYEKNRCGFDPIARYSKSCNR
jgi:hypothetical protein